MLMLLSRFLKYFSRKRTVSTEKKVVFYKSSFRRIIRSASNVRKMKEIEILIQKIERFVPYLNLIMMAIGFC